MLDVSIQVTSESNQLLESFNFLPQAITSNTQIIGTNHKMWKKNFDS